MQLHKYTRIHTAVPKVLRKMPDVLNAYNFNDRQDYLFYHHINVILMQESV